MAETFGPLLRKRRLASEDPATGRPYTQARLGELLGVSDKLISAWELGTQEPPIIPAYFNEVPKYLPVTTTELLAAAGLNVKEDPLTPLEKDALAELRRYRGRPDLQEQAIRVLRVLPAPRPHPTPTSPREGTRRLAEV